MYEMMMETTCLTFIVAANTSAPKSFTCEKMKYWPPTADALSTNASTKNLGWDPQKLKAGIRSFVISRVAKDTTDEIPFT
mmetsp:Transcript_12037/g.18081  ORF Transcript_12037/g.18081 Transcript_12037/m.18081 type:complete len:80 (-) Transcript_12037:231-470(-)